MSSEMKYFLLIVLMTFTMVMGATPPPKPAEKSCKLVLSDYNRQQVQNLGICTKKLDYKTGQEKVKKAMCILKCTMENQGLINQNGTIRVEELANYIVKNFPVSLQLKASNIFSPCLKRVPSFQEITSKKDETCKIYEPFIKCISVNYVQLCKATPPAPNKI